MNDQTSDAAPDASRPKRGSGVSTVHATLKREILELTIAPGSAIDEVALTERFGMSRTPIREALVKLAGEGLVVTLPNRGTVVAPIDVLDLPQFFDALTLMYRVTTRLAAAHRRDGELAGIRAHQAAYADAVSKRDVAAMIEVNRDFHAAIARAGRNGYYAELFERLLDEGRRLLRYYYSSFDDDLPLAFLDEHEEMIAAIEARDVARADRVAKAHADQIVRQIQAYVSRDTRINADLPL
ncbi:GntR family transcriptional regulator [Aquibium carbonis]|uniref:GntR family transcriptional regulator n=1 Tax=Aquibium carbonis TaxID=2495581 RepID=A0A429YWB5_9HYPH|nr:GntR family transcriptional regulator [Aquibium carbonis]RST85745.1 GntR family transcriptional regulator [Aquibium carbonis]